MLFRENSLTFHHHLGGKIPFFRLRNVGFLSLIYATWKVYGDRQPLPFILVEHHGPCILGLPIELGELAILAIYFYKQVSSNFFCQAAVAQVVRL